MTPQRFRTFRFSLRSALLAVLLIGAGGALLRNWAPWKDTGVLRENIDSSHLVISDNGCIALTQVYEAPSRIWDLSNGRDITELKGEVGDIRCEALSPNGQLAAAASKEGFLRIWNIKTGSNTEITTNDTGYVQFLCFSPDGRNLAKTSDVGVVQIWDAEKAILLTEMKGHTGRVNFVQYSRDGKRVVTAGDDHSARIWDAANGAPKARFDGHTSIVRAAEFSPNNSELLTASLDGTARVWDVQTGKEKLLLQHAKWVLSANYSPDGSRIVTHSIDGSTHLWNAATGVELASIKLRRHGAGFRDPSFSHDGQRFIEIDEEGDLIILSAYDSQWLVDFKSSSAVSCAFFQNSGMRIISFHRDGTVHLWQATGGLAWLPEFWATVVFAIGFLCSVRRDWRELKGQKAEG